VPADDPRFTAAVHWRRRLLAPTGRLGILELTRDSSPRATLTDAENGQVVFSATADDLRFKSAKPLSVMIECDQGKWWFWGTAPENRKQLERLEKRIGHREGVHVLWPVPPAFSPEKYRKITRNKMAHQKAWRELWLVMLRAVGAHEV
jgi:hypothetical protein